MTQHPPQDDVHKAIRRDGSLAEQAEVTSALARQELRVFAYRVVVTVLISTVIVAVAYFLWRGMHVLLEAFAGMLFALFLKALSDWVHRHTRLPYHLSLIIVVLGLCAIGGGFGYFLWHRLSTQLSELIQSLPRSLDQIRNYLMQYAWGKYLVENVPDAARGLAEDGPFTKVTGFVSGVATSLEAAIIVLIVGIFGAAEPGLYKMGFVHLVPPRQRQRFGEVLDASAYNLRHWLVGQLFLMLVIGITTWAGLELIGVSMALTLAIIAGVFEVVPYIGAWISAIPALLIALLKGPEYLAYTLTLFLFLHVLEGYVLLPLIQRRSVHLPPALTLVSQALMGEMFGILGLFVAAPLTVVVMVLLKMLYVEDMLGDETVNAPGEPGNELKQTVDQQRVVHHRGTEDTEKKKQ